MESEDIELLHSMMSERREAMELEAARWTHESSEDLAGPEATAQTRGLIHGVFRSYIEVLINGDTEPLDAFMDHVIELRAGMLFHVSTPQRGFFSFRKAVQTELTRTRAPQEQALRILLAIDDVYIESMYRLADGFSAKLSDTFEKLYEEAQHASTAKQNFLATMSHELRTPLNAILGTCEALHESVYGPLNEQQTAALSTVGLSGRHLLELISDLLDLSKIEADAFEPAMAPMSLSDLCSECVQLMRTGAKQAGLKLGLSMDGDADEIVSDVRYVRQMILNLLSNAVKFTPPGGKVRVLLEKRGSEVVVSVSDTGIGIAAADLPKLFGAFARIETGLDVAPAGTGLGLHLTRRLVAALGGRVEVVSEKGEGSQFDLILPIGTPPATASDERAGPGRPTAMAPTQSDNAPPPKSTGAQQSDSPANGLEVLLVDDTPGNIGHVRDFLTSRGHSVTVATNGVEAIEMSQALPDVVLMDVQMPVMDGLEATRRLRAADHTRDLYIVALTSYATGEDRARCLAAGANLHESKPIGLKRLLEIVDSSRERAPHEAQPRGGI